MTQREFIEEVMPLKDRIFRFAVSKTGSMDNGEEIVQEVFVRLWKQREKLGAATNKEAWCIRCTRNLIIDRYRAKKSVESLDRAYAMSSGNESDANILHDDLMQQVTQALKGLPEKQREVFRLRDLVGYSNQEIESILGMSQSEVRVNLCRARKTLRQLLRQKLRNGVKESINC